MGSPSLATLLALVFAAGASAATCADGSCVGNNGCCAATNECPPCLFQVFVNTKTHTVETTPSAQNTTCRCHGCAGETVTIDPACTDESSCSTGSRLCNCGSGSGCDFCSGPNGTCVPNAAALSACSLIKPRISISSSGLISPAGGNPGSGGNICNRCVGFICNLPGSAEGSILPLEANIGALCEACNACEACKGPCQYHQLTCPADSGGGGASGDGGVSCASCCPTGTCDGPDDASKPACEACTTCYNQGTPCPADWTDDWAAGGVSCPTGCVATRRSRARRLLFSSLPLGCGPGCKPM